MKNNLRRRALFALGLSFLLWSGSLSAQQAWSPYQRQLWFRPGIVHSEYNSAYLANSFAKYDDNVRITGGTVAFEYGITDRLTVDLTTGFGRLGRHRIFNPNNFWKPATPETPDKHGVLDTRAGIRYKILDEFDSRISWMPTVSLRIGGIKKGDYDRNPQALGDGANGGEVNLYLAKDFGFFGLGALGELGYRKRENPVPDDVPYYGALYKRFFESFFLFAGSRGQIGQGGYGFSDPRQQSPFNLIDLRPLNDLSTVNGINITDFLIREFRPPWGRRETFQNLEVGLGFMDSFGNFWNVFYAETINGYNTPKLRTVGFIVNMPYNL